MTTNLLMVSFLLGCGYVTIDALPFASNVDKAINNGVNISPNSIWVWSKEKELLVLWALINQINAYLLWGEAELNTYMGKIEIFIDDSD